VRLPPRLLEQVVVHVTVKSPSAGTDWPAWLTAGGTIVLAFGVLLAARQLREARVARLTEAAAEISRRWDGQDLVEARDAIDSFSDAIELRDAVISGLRGGAVGDQRVTDYNVLLREPDFFDDLGAQELLGGVTLQWVELTMKDIVLSRWDLWSLTVEGLKEIDGVSSYGNFERLAQKVKGEKLGCFDSLKRSLATRLLRALDY